MKRYKVGIIGCGRMGWLFNEDKLIHEPVSHIEAYSRYGRTDVTAVCDIDKDRLRSIARKYSIKSTYTDYKRMFKDEEFDIVSISTPTELHRDVCVSAARCGTRAIFCEKPIATSLKEAEDMIEACRENGVKLAVNHTRRWDNSFSAVKSMLDRNIIGGVNLVTAFSTAGLLNGGTHLFDLLRQYFGDVERVRGSIIPDESDDPGGRGSIKFKNGVVSFIDSSFRDFVLFGANIYGEDGVLEVGGRIRGKEVFKLFRTKKSKSEGGIKELQRVDCKVPKRTSPILNAVKNIVKTIEKREPLLCAGEDGKAALEIALVFHESSRKGREIPLPLKNKSLRVIPRKTSFTKDGRLR